MPGKSTGRKSRTFGTQTGGEEVVVSARDKGIQVGTYPDLAEKAKVTMQRQERGCFPKVSKHIDCNLQFFEWTLKLVIDLNVKMFTVKTKSSS